MYNNDKIKLTYMWLTYRTYKNDIQSCIAELNCRKTRHYDFTGGHLLDFFGKYKNKKLDKKILSPIINYVSCLF